MVELPEGRYGGVVVGSFVGSDSVDNGSFHPDRAHVDITRQHLGDGVILCIFLLHLKGDQYAV